MSKAKPTIFISYDLLPEGKSWVVGKNYRVRLVLKQVSMEEGGATYEVADATSLEPEDKGRRYYTSESGTMKV